MTYNDFRNRCTHLGYTIKEVSQEIGLSDGTIYNWEEVPSAGEYWLYWQEERNRRINLERGLKRLCDV